MADKRFDSCSDATRLACENTFLCKNNLHKLLSRMWAKNTEAICRIVCQWPKNQCDLDPNSGQMNDVQSFILVDGSLLLLLPLRFVGQGKIHRKKKEPKTIEISH